MGPAPKCDKAGFMQGDSIFSVDFKGQLISVLPDNNLNVEKGYVNKDLTLPKK